MRRVVSLKCLNFPFCIVTNPNFARTLGRNDLTNDHGSTTSRVSGSQSTGGLGLFSRSVNGLTPSHCLTEPPTPLRSSDPVDILLGDIASFDLDPDTYRSSTHVLVGCPQDIGVVRTGGRPGACEAPDRIREFLYKLKPPLSADPDSDAMQLLDLGNVLVTQKDRDLDLETIHESLFAVVRESLCDGKTVIVLGGGHDIAFSSGRALSHSLDSSFGFDRCAAVISVDAHLDMRMRISKSGSCVDGSSSLLHSGTSFRDLVDGGWIDSHLVHLVGIQPWANSSTYLSDAHELGVNVHTLSAIEPSPVFDEVFDELKQAQVDSNQAFLLASLDMDAIRASDAPGVSAPSPVGLSAQDVIAFADCCREFGQTAIFEVAEVNPSLDVDDRTSRLAALAIYAFLYGEQ